MKFNALALAVSVLASPVFATTKIVGTVEGIDMETNSYTILEQATGELHELTFKESSKIKINSKSYDELSALKVGDEVVYKLKPTKPVVSEASELLVTVKEVDLDNKLITFTSKLSATEQTLSFEGADIEEFAELKTGEKVVLKLGKKEKLLSSL